MAAQGALEEFFSKYSLYSIAETADIYELMDAQRRTQALEFGAGGLILALVILVWQVGRVRDARRTAEKANSAKSQFLANMSHEIRTPLNGIVAMTEVLGRSGLTPEQRDIAAVILNSSESLMTIVNDILDFSKIEAGGMSIEQIAFDVRATVEDAVRLFTPRAATEGARDRVPHRRGCSPHDRWRSAAYPAGSDEPAIERHQVYRDRRRRRGTGARRESGTRARLFFFAWSIPASASLPKLRASCFAPSPRPIPPRRASSAVRV